MGCSSSLPDRGSGGLVGPNGDNGGAADAKNLRVKLVLLGDSGVGKSCIVLRFVRGQFDPTSKGGDFPKGNGIGGESIYGGKFAGGFNPLKMSALQPGNTSEEDFSAAATTISFDRPVPLLRGPIQAGPPDDPFSGPYVMAFRNPKTWADAYRASESKILHQCMGGSRIGCAINAASKCKPPWWRFLIGQKASGLKERAECEERETEGCLVTAKEKCVGFAREKCLTPFREARVCGVSKRQAEKMVGWGSVMGKSRWMDLIGLENCGFGVTNCRAGELVGCCGEVDRK